VGEAAWCSLPSWLGKGSVAGCWRASASLLPAGWVSVLGLAASLAGTEDVPGAVDAPPVLPPLPACGHPCHLSSRHSADAVAAVLAAIAALPAAGAAAALSAAGAAGTATLTTASAASPVTRGGNRLIRDLEDALSHKEFGITAPNAGTASYWRCHPWRVEQLSERCAVLIARVELPFLR
jgi:hypothetical protein